MAGLRFNWFTLGEKKKVSCLCRFPWKPINLNGITKWICDFFIHYILQSDLIREDQGPEHVVTGLTWRISSWQVFALWHNSCNMTAENLVVRPSYMNKLPQSGTASFSAFIIMSVSFHLNAVGLNRMWCLLLFSPGLLGSCRKHTYRCPWQVLVFVQAKIQPLFFLSSFNSWTLFHLLKK